MNRSLASVLVAFASTAVLAQPPGEGPARPEPRITQAMILAGMPFAHIRDFGMRMFATPFNKFDGWGDGPMNPFDPTRPGHRPTLQDNGSFLRVNGLDAQTCVECHAIVSTATVPFRLGIGGLGGANNNAMAGPTLIDVSDSGRNGFAAFNGRFINPPFLFGAGGVELVAKEMTMELQRLAEKARRNPREWVELIAKGVSFGEIRWVGGTFDHSRVAGVEHDLAVRPFGRKGEFATTRAFDVEALQFHFGMQPVEALTQGDADADGDGVFNEATIGELSSMAVFTTTLETPRVDGREPLGRRLFAEAGCAECHRPFLDTDTPFLTYSFPEVPTDPMRNAYYAVDLRQPPPAFPSAPGGGIRVPMFSDLKRHDMGPGLAESTGGRLDRFFVTARLWGIADSGPYLHDGRALTLTDAILAHGGEAQSARDAFAALPATDRVAVLSFLRTLRTPERLSTD